MTGSEVYESMPRIRRVQSQREQDKLVDEFMTRGYTVKEQGQYTTKLKEKNRGEAIMHVFVFVGALVLGAVIFSVANLPSGGVWIFIFVANLTYAGYSQYTAETVLIKLDSETRADAEIPY